MKDIPWEALVGLAGLLLSLPQLTSRARLRRRMSFWAEQIQSTDIAYDRDVAEGFRRQATAKLLAVEAYPAYTLLVPLYSAFIGLLSAFSSGAVLGEVYPNHVSIESLAASESGTGALLFGLVGPGFIYVSILGMASVVGARRDVADKYLTARVMKRQAREPFRIPVAEVFRVVAFTLGVYLFIVCLIFWLVVGNEALTEMTALGSRVLIGSVLGAILLMLVGGPLVQRFFEPTDAAWKHPITLSAEVAATRPPKRDRKSVV